MPTNTKLSNTQLKIICFSKCDNNLLNVVIDAPNLKKFKFRGDTNPSLSITIRSQANCNIHIHTYALYFDTYGFFKLKKLLKGLNSCNILKIFLRLESSKVPATDGDGDEDGEKSGNAGLGPPCDIGELKINMYSYWELSSSPLSAFLNGLFWTCHPRIISLRVESRYRKLAVEPLLNKLVDMDKYLRHPLKRIEVEETTSGFDFLDVQMRLCW
ncbi:uncharacterized protein LOC141609295 [Silene latifolia]|uniref:uncharacterized protein LOC141609295 n=1 Tax=Silene latifolia TaxID=37657 RepID=UPI003D77B1B7